MAAPLLSVDGVCFAYGRAPAIAGVSFTLEGGGAIAVLGPNGAGKSTLARVLSGLVRADRGHITFDGQDMIGVSPDEVRKRGICYLPEGRGVFPGLSVQDNLRLAARVEPRGERAAAVERGMAAFPALQSRSRQQAASLSGGEQQMLALARVAVSRPRLIIADELSLGLAPMIVDAIFESLEQFRADGVAIILIEQFVHRALDFVDAALVLQRGEVGWSGDPADAHGEVLSRYLGQPEPV